jgi:hypothetical protein
MKIKIKKYNKTKLLFKIYKHNLIKLWMKKDNLSYKINNFMKKNYKLKFKHLSYYKVII